MSTKISIDIVTQCPKQSEPMASQRFFPRKLSDRFAFLFLLIAVISIYLFEICTVAPTIHQEALFCYVHATCGFFIFANILGNLVMMMSSDTTTRGLILPAVLKPDWHFCFACEANSPPRAFHCDICQTCVLKRDHHCTFAGCCVGQKNFRYFVMFLLHLTIGSLYATILNMFFIWDVLEGFSGFSILAHIIPFLFWVLGYLSFRTMLYTLLSVISLTGFMFVLNLMILHVRQLLRNQTSFEKNHAICNYDLGWRQNIIESFGTKWHLVWLSPIIKSPLPSNGVSFMTNANFSTFSGKMK